MGEMGRVCQRTQCPLGSGPFRVEASLMFRAFPPFLIKAFAAYEREQARRGLRPSGPLVTDEMLIAAAQALADVVSPDEIGPHYIIPSVFHPDVASSVAVAVRDAATQQLAR